MRDYCQKAACQPLIRKLGEIAADLAESLNLNTSFVILSKLDEYMRVTTAKYSV